MLWWKSESNKSTTESRLFNFDILCWFLGNSGSADGEALRDNLIASRVDWQQVIEAAGEHLVLPLLWRQLSLRGRQLNLPALVCSLLKDLYQRNEERNRRLRTQAAEIGVALDEIGVRAVLLKGANNLFEPHPIGDRMMLDLDLLVPESRLAECVARLQCLGYTAPDASSDGFHYPPLCKPGCLATVELHVSIGEQRHILPAAEAFAAATPVHPGLATLSATHRIVHNVFHATAQNRGYSLAFAPLKELCDFTSIAGAHAADIDWAEVRRRFAPQPWLLTTYSGLAVRLLNWTPPSALGEARIGTLRYQRCRWQISQALPRRMVELWAAATWPLRRTHMEFLFGPSPNQAVLAKRRLRHLATLLRRHKGQVFARLVVARQYYRDQRRSLSW